MPSSDGSDLVNVIASEVAKQLPVRQALEPAATQVGGLTSDIVKCVRLALAPIQYLAVQQDRYRRFIEKSAESVPTHQRVQPAPQILGPVLEGIRYETEGSLSDEAFSELLARAFDRERMHQAHPAFPAMLRSMADDEIRLFNKLKNEIIIVHAGRMHQGTEVSITEEKIISNLDYLIFPKQILAYCTHLEALGLVHGLVGQTEDNTDFNSPYDVYYHLHLSALGKLFASAVFKE